MKREKLIERCVIACGCTDKLARSIHEEMPSIARSSKLERFEKRQREMNRPQSWDFCSREAPERALPPSSTLNDDDPSSLLSVPLLSTRPRGGCTEFHRSNSHTTTSPLTSRRRNDEIAISPRVGIEAEIKETPLFYYSTTLCQSSGSLSIFFSCD